MIYPTIAQRRRSTPPSRGVIFRWRNSGRLVFIASLGLVALLILIGALVFGWLTRMAR
jgi:hypothetical protein